MGIEKTAMRPCPICNETRVEILHRLHFHLARNTPLPEAYDLVGCPHCGFVYADTTGNQADYDRYYTEFSRYEDAATASGGADNEADARRLEETARWLEKHIAPEMRVMDIGCGNGGLLKALSRRGAPIRASGIDPAPRCVRRLIDEGFAAHPGHLAHLPENCGTHDLIILSHVLEHVVNLSGALLAVRRLLAPHGKLYVETPDASRYHLENLPPFYFFDPEHINHFDAASLKCLGAKNAWRTTDCIEKTILLPNDRRYPAVGLILEPDDSASAHELDGTALKEKIAAYVALSRQKSRDAEASLANAVLNRPVVLWGAGSQAQRLLESSPLKQARIVAVVDRDSNKQGQFFAHCMIQPPEKGLRHLPENTLVVIAAATHAETIRNEVATIDERLPCFIP
ncbi:MAG: class I SAM-dependent methyltransferase [Zoogloeaceae bacterium]|jgi:2-polyprenyl-3-methyl-5-hydroxy-6-metoxy-1,4-benzoquinol methylase|nr:class I SAM-dependent methyltransferase [Zoogloeaceae bacterium]